jgi:PAS domain S-box-containing protein
MEKENLDIQVLLELALNQRVSGEIESSLPKTLNLYLRKLNCFAVAVYQKGNWPFVLPKALKSSEEWWDKLSEFSSRIIEGNTNPIAAEISGSHYYGFPLYTYGWLVLIRKNSISFEMLAELNKVTYQLGRDLSQATEEQHLKILQHLFDKATDAIKIYDENGKLYYINEIAAIGMGLEKPTGETSNLGYTLLPSPEHWSDQLQELQEKGKVVYERENFSHKKGRYTPEETTVNLIRIKDKNFVIENSRDISIRKKQEQHLRETNQKLESIFNEMTDVVWSVSIPDFALVFVTPSIEGLFEIPVSEFEKDNSLWKKVIHEEDREVISKIFRQLEDLGVFNVKYRVVTPSGKIKWVRNKGKYIFDKSSNPIRIDGVVLDRTTQYHAQESLEQEVRLQEALIDIASTYINLDPKDLENTINESLQKMGIFVSADRAYIFDYDFEKGTTSNTYEWCNEGINPEIESLQEVPIEYIPYWVEAHRRNEAFYVPDVFSLAEDGEGGLRSILEPQGIKSLIAIPMLDGKELIGFVGFDSVVSHHQYSDKEKRLLFLFGQMLINIRNRQKWEKQLRLQEEKFRNIIANMNLGLLEVDMEDVIVYANQSFCEISGFSLAELKGKRAAELLLTDAQREIIYDKNNKRRYGITDSYELEVMDRQGKPRWWFVSGAPNYNDKGQLIGSIGVHLDISDQKQLERELAKAKNFAEAAAKAKELFLANMSHEIRTPLNVIIGMIRLLSKETLTSDQKFFVKQSESSAKHLLTIINNVLDIAKIESGDLELVESEFSPSALAYNVHSILYSQAIEKNLDFSLNVSSEIRPVLKGDETRLRQVMINLLGNAIKFTNKGRVNLTLKVLETTETHQTIQIETTDTGIGMSEEFVQKIFDKFSQEQNHSNRKYEGTGLGMAIANDLVKLMGSKMIVNSIRDIGTIIKFDLRLAIGHSENLTSKSQQIKQHAFKGKKALLVEDNEMNRFIAMQSLDYLGFETMEAENGQRAIEIASNHTFDIILMDIQMPIMDGVEATIHLREKLKLSAPIVALTANAFKHDIDRYLQIGMNDFITKPYDEQDFFRKVDYVLTYNTLMLGNALDGVSDHLLGSKVEPLYDLSLLAKIGRGNREFISKMTRIFIILAKENCTVLQSALEERDLITLQKTAHKIKPSIDQLGIVSLKEVVRKVEKYDMEQGSIMELESMVNRLIDTLNQVSIDLEQDPLFSK